MMLHRVKNKSYPSLRLWASALSLPALTALLFACAACGGEAVLPSTPINNEPGTPDNEPSTPSSEPPPTSTCSASLPTEPQLTEPCNIDLQDPTKLVVATTDFSSGGISIIDLATGESSVNVAVSETDTRTISHDGLIYVLHRFGFDRIDVLDPAQNYAQIQQFPLKSDRGENLNPQGIAFSHGLAFVSLRGVGELLVMDFNQEPDNAVIKRIDLSSYIDSSDDDDNPNSGTIFACGQTVFVALNRQTSGFAAAGTPSLLPIDALSCDAFAPEHEIPSLAKAPGQILLDPKSSTGHHVFGLSSGIERIDLAAGSSAWQIAPSAFANAGIGHAFALQSMAIDDNDTAYIAAYRADFSATDIFAVPLGRAAPAEIMVRDLTSNGAAIHITGNTLWFGNRTPGDEGVIRFDLSQDPPTRIDETPIDTGLPPLSISLAP